MDCEIWNPISDYEGLYEVSNFGRIKSLTRKVKRVNPKRNIHFLTINEKILGYYEDDVGRPRIMLSKNGKKKFHHISKLVYKAFKGNIPKGMHVDHINRNFKDNNIKNLRLLTPKENMRNKNLVRGLCKGTDNEFKVRIYIGSYKVEKEATKAYNDALSLLKDKFPILKLVPYND